MGSAAPGTRLHHVAFGARDVELVAGFYRELFALPEVARHADEAGALRSVWLDLAGTLLMIEQVTGGGSPPRRDAPGPFLLAVAVTPRERLRLETVLAAQGYRIESRTAYTSYGRDPEGNRFAFSTWPEPSSAAE